VTTTSSEGPISERVSAATQAYIYGYPLVYCVHELGAFVAGGGRFPMQAPYNEFGHARRLAGPEFKFVSPNNDTAYSVAVCDLRQGAGAARARHGRPLLRAAVHRRVDEQLRLPRAPRDWHCLPRGSTSWCRAAMPAKPRKGCRSFTPQRVSF
jgi:hypothetical protein